MKEYNYSDIVSFDEIGILFLDGVFVEFEECRNEWAYENNISANHTMCVASRFFERNEMWFIFYSKEKIKLKFIFKGILKNIKSRKKFKEVQMLLHKYGYTTYDMS